MPIRLDRETVGYALPRAVQAGMRWRPNTGAGRDRRPRRSRWSTSSRAGRADRRDVDTVVIRTHGVADDALYFALQGRVPEVVRVGDAVAVRPADRAIFDGHMAGRAPVSGSPRHAGVCS